ncbi:MAG: VOC family protein [Gammaproteobacteria bacterium]
MSDSSPTDPGILHNRYSGPPTLSQSNGFEIYPMPFFALIAASEPANLAGWYQKALGFSVLQVGPAFHLRRRKYQDLLLVPAQDERIPTLGGPLLYFDADGELEVLAERIEKAGKVGLVNVSGPLATLWNTSELRVTDPTGYRFVFTSRPRDPDPDIQSRVATILTSAHRLGKPV